MIPDVCQSVMRLHCANMAESIQVQRGVETRGTEGTLRTLYLMRLTISSGDSMQLSRYYFGHLLKFSPQDKKEQMRVLVKLGVSRNMLSLAEAPIRSWGGFRMGLVGH